MDYKGVGTPMGPSSPYCELIYHDSKIYKGWIDSKFTLLHKGVLVIIQGCIGDSEQSL